MKIALIGAGSRCFGPATLRDLFLSRPLAARPFDVCLMDVDAEAVDRTLGYARHLNDRLGRAVQVTATADLDTAVRDAAFVVTCFEHRREHYWAMDFHVPRMYGFKQPYGENGGVGGIFHTLRNIPPLMEVARAIERLAPDAWLLNYTNPENRLVEAVGALTQVRAVGLCHGIVKGREQVCALLGIEDEHLEAWAAGINHFTVFESLRDARTGEDLYPRLREAEARGDELVRWHELALGRVILRRFGRWPSPSANHYGEYLAWGHDFVLSGVQYYYDPARGHPWETGAAPRFIYEIADGDTDRPWSEPPPAPPPDPREAELVPSIEHGVPVIEGLSGDERIIHAVNVVNGGAIPNLPADSVVEVPAVVGPDGVRPREMRPLPEALAAVLRTQLSVHKLIIEAYRERSKDALIQAVLLDPTVDSYPRAIAMTDHLLTLQKDVLPPLG
ncbi:hypothetical protein [Spongiactinospora sp. TRM90649]|uniref:family 4 glycosyl hydrolase n=1 Tax=Spongiactinospora sp. TRM90649 TaxID=3031114 RepID=UPI0023FA30C5|nr:hypothetical protein [Spongiactinospora sp. TRM90649]MDF5756987.1 hypothetical protein [Spongiactinospora sp. TRM90649]